MRRTPFFLCLIGLLLTACMVAKSPEPSTEEPIFIEDNAEEIDFVDQEGALSAQWEDVLDIPSMLEGEISARFPQYNPIGASDFVLRLNTIFYEAAYALLQPDVSKPTVYMCDYRTTYQSERLTSFRYEYYTSQSPAAHGLSACSGFTIDWEREEVLSLCAFFGAHPIWKEVVNDCMRAYLHDEEIALFDITAFEGVMDDQTFYLTDTAFVLVYPPYLYTPGALGILEIPVPFVAVASQLREEYRYTLLPELDSADTEKAEQEG